MSDENDPMHYQVGGDHYRSMKIQPIDYMRAIMPADQFEGFCRGNALKYLSRYGRKGSRIEDAKKARHYMDFLIEALEDKA